MALVAPPDRVKFSTASTGTGSLAIGAAAAGHQLPGDSPAGQVWPYVLLELFGSATEAAPSAWETGRCTVSGPALTRVAIDQTSAGGTAPLNLRAGSHVVMLGLTAAAATELVGLPGPPGTVIPFTQSTPAAVWSLVHNLGRFPGSVVITDPSGIAVWAEVQNYSVNEVRVYFGSPQTGSAYIS